ncbi:aminotransferase class I/II-fold pyridoxal phosphate-dependent enzyme [Gorillibacterium sp. sgz5001074]|uniref:aminotransferase class I/II-fold pyridoxal phosphate-dependent enzyme n=1 Tax=Gorillibacterium sp. sgz5001074 TaxID=3446695 RepID=UPI003F67732F
MAKWHSERLSRLGSAIFSEVAEWKREARARGLELIDLGIGSPDGAPTETVLQAMERAVRNPKLYGYPTSEGSSAFRQKVADWYAHRFGVSLDPASEITALMGSQDGLAHLAMAVANPGDKALVPDPGYPIYSASLVLAGMEPYPVPLLEENGFLPDLEAIPAEVLDSAAFLLLNYPSNPVSAVADLSFFEKVLYLGFKHDLLIVHDIAYSELAFDGYRPPSILQLPDAKRTAVEFHSLSKSFNMAGCRIAFMVGNADAVGALKTLKSNIDYGVFLASQEAGIAAMDEDIRSGTGRLNAEVYQRRRDLVVDGLEAWGWSIRKPKATMFLWAPVPEGASSREFARRMALETGVVVIPGDAFGANGEGYVRIALVQEDPDLAQAVERMGRFVCGWRM